MKKLLSLLIIALDGNVTKFVTAGVDSISFTCPDTFCDILL